MKKQNSHMSKILKSIISQVLEVVRKWRAMLGRRGGGIL